MSPHTFPSFFLWIVFCNLITKQVMDFQELAGWLDEATFFPSPTKPTDDSPTISFDDIISDSSTGKAQNPAFLDFNDVFDIFEEDGWMDEKIDLAILDSAQDCLPPENDASTDTSAATLLESIVDSDLFSGPFAVLNPDELNSTSSPNHQGASFERETSFASVLPDVGLQLPTSPADSCSVYSGSSAAASPLNADESYSDAGGDTTAEIGSSDSPSTFCIEIIPEINYLVVNTEGVAENEESKSPVKLSPPSGKDLSLVRKTMKSRAHPYASANQLKKESRRERKKVQNKEAAARYRVKRREQEKILADEVASLEATQHELKDKHDKLKSEITYLKSLMRDLFKARGLLK